MSFLLNYLYCRRRIIAVILTVSAVFVLFMLLYGIPAESVAYSGLICFVVTAAAAFGDFWRYRRKFRLLTNLSGEVLMTLEHLPDYDNEIEHCYQRLLEILHREKTDLVSAADRRYSSASAYFTMWTHQIKTPISAMSLLLQENDTDEAQELAEYLSKIEQYVEMALCYVHLDNDQNDFVIRPHPLDKIVKQAIRKFSAQFIRRKIKLLYVPTNIRVLTDEKWLLFVLEQVISNALKYTKAGSVSIEVKNDGRLGNVLSVSDTGIGIDPDDLPRIFERGYTGQNGRLDKKATGIGLYLCRRICSQLGQRIEARSDGHGAEFLISLDVPSLDVRD